MEEQAAAEASGTSDSAAEEEALLRGGDQDYPKELSYAVDNLHESSVISICAWPGQNHQLLTGSGTHAKPRQLTFMQQLLQGSCLHGASHRATLLWHRQWPHTAHRLQTR